VEGIQSQLRRRLTDGLGSKGTHHFTRMDLALDVAEANLTNEFVKDRLGEAMVQNALARRQVES